MKKVIKISGTILVVGILLTVVGFMVYVSDYELATEPALSALESTDKVIVEDLEDYIAFRPTETTEIGLIFYPGGKVEPSVYSRISTKLAEEGIQTFVVKMPFNLAMFNVNGADDIIENQKHIKTWYMGGHSLGGVFATEYLKNHESQFKGMIYMASYPNTDISNLDVDVLSLTGTLDSVMNKDGYENGKTLLPSDVLYYEIIGGNHTQFGDYNLQSGDTKAKITPEEQQKEVVEAIVTFILND